MRERCRFVCAAVIELEASAPEAVVRMVEQSKVAHVMLSEDGTQAISLRSSEVKWDAASRPTGLTHVYKHISDSCDSAAAAVVFTADPTHFLSKPYTRPLPAVMLDYIVAEPTSELARQVWYHVTHDLLIRLRFRLYR